MPIMTCYDHILAMMRTIRESENHSHYRDNLYSGLAKGKPKSRVASQPAAVTTSVLLMTVHVEYAILLNEDFESLFDETGAQINVDQVIASPADWHDVDHDTLLLGEALQNSQFDMNSHQKHRGGHGRWLRRHTCAHPFHRRDSQSPR
jgi:hypothetical protein